MWQTARPAPTMIPVVRRRASVVFSLDGLCTRAMISSRQAAKGQRVAAKARDLFDPKQDPSQGARRRGIRGACVWLWLKRHGGPAAPDSGCRLAGLAGWLHAPSYICVRD